MDLFGEISRLVFNFDLDLYNMNGMHNSNKV